MAAIHITASSLVTALGHGRQAHLDAIEGRRSGLTPWIDGGLELQAGAVAGVDDIALSGDLAAFDCRNNRLAELGLQTDALAEQIARAVKRHGADRIGVFLATSTGGMRETEIAFGQIGEGDAISPDFPLNTQHRLCATTDYVRRRLGLRGPAQSISTACSSSAKVFATAARYIRAGLCDAALVGGVDTLCRTTLFGFHALELTSQGRCRPFSGDRDGMCLGEGAAFALLEPATGAGGVALLGHGESTDAWHMSTPHPEALGARLAMRRALDSAGLAPGAIDYVNLHGTATPANDSAEDMALAEELGNEVPASSTKGWTGHTLGAAGAVEALLCALAIDTHVVPGTLNTAQCDDTMRCNILLENRSLELRCVLSNSFGFGGNNCALVVGWAT